MLLTHALVAKPIKPVTLGVPRFSVSSSFLGIYITLSELRVRVTYQSAYVQDVGVIVADSVG